MHVTQGEVIMAQGCRGDCVYFLWRGSVQAEKDGEVVWAQYSRGDYFGELALRGLSAVREATVRAASSVPLLSAADSLPSSSFTREAAACPA